MSAISGILSSILQLFLLALFARLILDYVRMFSRSWTPKGIVLLFAEFVYAVTDPVMKIARKFIPPLRLGPVALDLSFIVVFIGVQLLSRLVSSLH